MAKYKLVSVVYFTSILASSIANFFSANVQTVYRVPFLNIRWVDLAIILIVVISISKLIFKYKNRLNNSLLINLIYAFVTFETIQLFRTWGVTETNWQIAGFLCTLTIFIIIDLSTFRIKKDEIVQFVRSFSLCGAVVLTLSNAYLFYSFLAGNIKLDSTGIRVSIDVIGSTESVYTSVLTPLVYGFGIYLVTSKITKWEKAIYFFSILSIYVSQIILFERGVLVMITLITLYFLIYTESIGKTIIKTAGLILLISIFYILFGNILREKGYDPVQKLIETAQFAADVNNPDWDKGRHIPREFAINAWEKNLWFGVGYDTLNNYGLPDDIEGAHNFVLTSLFHRGILGTALYLGILLLLFIKAIKLWQILKRDKNVENNLMKILIIVSFLWLIPFWTQEAHWEKYSLSIEFMYLGFITNFYGQVRTELSIRPEFNLYGSNSPPLEAL